MTADNPTRIAELKAAEKTIEKTARLRFDLEKERDELRALLVNLMLTQHRV